MVGLKSKSLDKVRSDVPVADVTNETDTSKVRINLNVSDGLRKEWKRVALDKGLSLQEMIIKAVNEYMSK